MAHSDAIFDIQHPKQTGLAMRTIETIRLGKKIITTNLNIRNYDFYNENNVLIIGRERLIIPKQFIEGNYESLNTELYQKYSLDGVTRFSEKEVERVFGAKQISTVYGVGEEVTEIYNSEARMGFVII